MTRPNLAAMVWLSLALAPQRRSVNHAAGTTTAARVSRPAAGITLAVWTPRRP
jgi:hypothetical protein